MASFTPLPARRNFAQCEEATLAYWKEIDAFKTSQELNKDKPVFSFYDGPPFATGLPHHGHILAGTIKDSVTRYAHMTGHHVERRFGWDCHGVPVEMVVEKELKISTREEVLEMGIEAYNAKCRSVVLRYASEWERIVGRVGRWIDFDNDYKTMDTSFMESVWWVFGELYAKGLVYQGFKVMPYSMACATPLSNFEAGLNYKDVSDPAVTVTFPLADEEGVALLAWTTTPWTLPSNLALCVNPEATYVRVHDEAKGMDFIMMRERLDAVYPPKKKKKGKKKKDEGDAADGPAYTIVGEMLGAELGGRRYVPLFDFFVGAPESEGYFQVLTDTYVTSESGTGVVHQAPAFGEDDYRVCMEAGVIVKRGELPCPIDHNGRFTAAVGPFAGLGVKEADKPIQAALKAAGRLFKAEAIVHSYPFCYRTDTPLIYRAVPSWFVSVTSLTERLLANNDETYWVPEFVGASRFRNWLANARDWAISRNRFWGTPLPIWTSPDGEEIVIVSSVAELEEKTGVTGITDLHRDTIDGLTIPSARGPEFPPLTRVEEVFDCWFESGSMPYAQKHYPFENSDAFERDYFPADFIAEGLDQTRGWFYTLLVISTALFNKAPYKNLIVNGLVLASDGKKMSKSKMNFPDPETEVINVYGADALRLYLINSPVVRAEPVCFQTRGVLGVIRDVFNPWYNAERFFLEFAAELASAGGPPVSIDRAAESTNLLDRWILSELETLIAFVRAEMAAYRLYTVVPQLLTFIEYLTNWWLRLNRARLKGMDSAADAAVALSVLFKVLFKLAVAMAPFTPFLVEDLYQSLRPGLPPALSVDSVHYLDYPTVDESARDASVEAAVRAMRETIQLARTIRDQVKRSVKYPLRGMVIIHSDPTYADVIAPVLDYVKSEANVETIVMEPSFDAYVDAKFSPNRRALGPRFKKAASAMVKKLEALDSATVAQFLVDGVVVVDGESFGPDEVAVVFEKKADAGDSEYELATDGPLVVLLDTTFDQRLEDKGCARELLSNIQRLRKSANLVVSDVVDVWVDLAAAPALVPVVANNADVFVSTLRYPVRPASARPPTAPLIATQSVTIGDSTTTITFTRPVPVLADPAGVDPAVVAFVASLNPAGFADGDAVAFDFNGTAYAYVWGDSVVLSSSM